MLGASVPRVRSAPEYEFTSGPDAVAIYESTGRSLDAWQRDALNDHCAETPMGTWLTLESLEEVSRQNGKGEIINALILLHLFVLGTRTVIYSAHEFKTAKESYLKLYELIKNTPDLDDQVAERGYKHSNEDTSIILKTGQRIRFLTRSKDGGRGFTGDAIIFDEAFNITRAALSALLPTLSAVSNPHIYYFSSAPKATEESDVLRELDSRAEAGDETLVARIWGAHPDSDTDDPAALAVANPALGIRITERFTEVERKGMTEDDFRRERLGIPDEKNAYSSKFPRGVWAAGYEPKPSALSAPSVAVDLRTGAYQSLAIAVASIRADGGDDIDLAAYELGADEQWARDFAVKEVRRILTDHGIGSVAVDQYGDGNGVLIQRLEDAGVVVQKFNTTDMRNGAVGLVDGLVNGLVKHHNDDDLNAAVVGARTKKSGDGYLWDQAASAVDITPLRAVTAAWWALQVARSVDYDVAASYF